MTYSLILTGSIALGVFAMIAALISRYKRCPSDKLLVVYGRTGKSADGKTSTAAVYHGGGAFIWPVIQDYSFLDLKPMAIDVDLKGALSKQNIRIDVPSTFTIAVSTEPATMINAAERLLGMQRQEIATLAKDIILGQLRLVIATMDIEEINSDRDKFLSAIQNNLETELDKVGLRLINVNVTDIQDESGYIKALGQEAAAKALNDAKISVAQKNRDGAIGSGEAEREQKIKTSELNAAAEIGMADAATKSEIGKSDAAARQRAKTAELNAQAVEGENKAAMHIAATFAERQVAEAEAQRKATTAQNVARASAEKDSYEAQRAAEAARAEKDKATLYANEVVPAEIEKNRITIEAAAEAERIRQIAQGEADAVFLKKQAEAKGIEEILKKQAEGFRTLVESAGGADNAVQLLIADKLPELMKIQVEAIKNIKIDKITVWDNGGNNADGNTTTGNFLQGLLNALPAYDDLYKMTGKELPQLLNIGGAEEVQVEETKPAKGKGKSKPSTEDNA
jgi:flotillin